MSTINPGDLSFIEIIPVLNTWESVSVRAFASTCKLENSKIVRNGHQHTKATEDEELFCINAYPPIEKHSNKDLNTTIHLKKIEAKV